MTSEQRQVARLLCLGVPAKQIGRRLGMSGKAVRARLSRAYAVAEVSSQAEFVGWCVVHGVVSLDELRAVYAHKGPTAAGAGAR